MNEIGIEIKLNYDDDFLIIKETLTRIGIASKKDKTLYQSALLLHKQGKYYIVHFKSMFKLDGKESNITEEDLARRNAIAQLLQDWNLCKIISPELYENKASLGSIKIISHKEKNDWNLVTKYKLGNS